MVIANTAMLLDTELLRVWVHEPRSIVFMRRSDRPMPRAEEDLRVVFEAVVDAMSEIHRPDYDIVVDSRQAVGRNDATFERVQAEYRWGMFGEYRRVAVVMRTLAGRMQLTRYATERVSIDTLLFGSLSEALHYLGQPIAYQASKQVSG